MADVTTTETVPVEAQSNGAAGLDAKGLGAGIATAAVVGVGVALIEAAWIPGIVIGVAAMAFPKLVPSVTKGVKPMLRSAIKTGYSATQKTREWMAEAGEQVSDMVAEVRAAAVEDVPSSTGVAEAEPAAAVPARPIRAMKPRAAVEPMA